MRDRAAMRSRGPAKFWHVLATPLRLALVALFALLTCGPAVIAENTQSGASFFVRERQQMQQLQPSRRPAPQLQALRPRQQARHPARPAPAPPAPVYYSAPVRVAIPQAAPPAGDKLPPSYSVAVLGDSLAVQLTQGLQEAFAERPELAFLRKGRESSGLVRDDFYNWPKSIAELLAGTEHIDLAIMMIGSNDRQALRDGAVDVEPLSPRWRELYAARVEALAAQFRDRGIKLIWVGMPSMKNERYASELAELNEIFRTRAAKAGAVYIDIWEAFLNDGGKYDASGPDVNGEIARLRAGDGIHFTKAGARKLAHFVEAEVKRGFEATAPKAEPEFAALPPFVPDETPAPPAIAMPAAAEPANIDINSLIRRAAEGEARAPEAQGAAPAPAPEPSIQASLALPAEAPALYIPVRPAAGPVMMLTAPILAPGGALARRESAASGGEAQALIDRAFRQGVLPPPRRHAAFAWPRSQP